MQDEHKFFTSDGRILPVREMPTEEILGCLADGIKIRQSGGSDSAERIRLRLEIELIIRKIENESPTARPL